MGPAEWVYLNGSFVKADEASLSPFDRGLLFAHAAYEVTAVFNGKLIDFEGHARRLFRTLEGIEIPPPFDADALYAEVTSAGSRARLLAFRRISSEPGSRSLTDSTKTQLGRG